MEDQKVEQPAEEKKEISIDEFNALRAENEKFKGTNDRLLEESKEWKTKFQGLRNDVSEEQTAKLTNDKNWEGLLEVEKQKNFDLQKKNDDRAKKVLNSDLNFKVASFAPDAHNVNAIIDLLPKEMLDIDEENLTVSGVEDAVSKLRETDAWAFKSDKKVGMAGNPPSRRAPREKTLSEMSTDEKRLKLRENLGKLI